MFTTRDIAVYAAVVATISGVWSVAWSIYSGLLRDRVRIKLVVYNAEAWDVDFEHAEDAIMFAVYNRGRRTFNISDLVRVSSVLRGTRAVSMVLQRQIRAEDQAIAEGQGKTYRIGGHGDYAHGDLPLERWCVIDQAGRTYPLRERYRQRAERVVFWPARKLLEWWDKRDGDDAQPEA